MFERKPDFTKNFKKYKTLSFNYYPEKVLSLSENTVLFNTKRSFYIWNIEKNKKLKTVILPKNFKGRTVTGLERLPNDHYAIVSKLGHTGSTAGIRQEQSLHIVNIDTDKEARIIAEFPDIFNFHDQMNYPAHDVDVIALSDNIIYCSAKGYQHYLAFDIEAKHSEKKSWPELSFYNLSRLSNNMVVANCNTEKGNGWKIIDPNNAMKVVYSSPLLKNYIFCQFILNIANNEYILNLKSPSQSRTVNVELFDIEKQKNIFSTEIKFANKLSGVLSNGLFLFDTLNGGELHECLILKNFIAIKEKEYLEVLNESTPLLTAINQNIVLPFLFQPVTINKRKKAVEKIKASKKADNYNNDNLILSRRI